MGVELGAPFYIGRVKLESNILMAPMAGFSDKSFRKIAREYGAALTYSEMLSAKSVLYNNYKDLLDTDEDEKFWGAQLFGREPALMALAAKQIIKEKPSILLIDVNMGCPAPKIVKNGEGAALMNEPDLAAEIIKAITQKVNVPVTAKIRKGFARLNAREVALALEAAGASAITVHGRTREQFYSGTSDLDAIAEVARALKIPVIANGDIKNRADAKRALEYTGASGVMLARAAVGAPWIFSEVLSKTLQINKISVALRHLDLICEHKGEERGVLEARKLLAHYIKGIENASVIRSRLFEARTKKEIKDLLKKSWNN